MKVTISGLERDLSHQSEQKALFQAKALESCELSEMWAEKYRQDHDKRKRVRQRIMGEALAAIRRRLGRSIKFSTLLVWRNLAGRAVRSLRQSTASRTSPVRFFAPLRSAHPARAKFSSGCTHAHGARAGYRASMARAARTFRKRALERSLRARCLRLDAYLSEHEDDLSTSASSVFILPSCYTSASSPWAHEAASAAPIGSHQAPRDTLGTADGDEWNHMGAALFGVSPEGSPGRGMGGLLPSGREGGVVALVLGVWARAVRASRVVYAQVERGMPELQARRQRDVLVGWCVFAPLRDARIWIS